MWLLRREARPHKGTGVLWRGQHVCRGENPADEVYSDFNPQCRFSEQMSCQGIEVDK